MDDEADLVATYERLLRRQGYRVVSAGTLQDGLRVIETEPLRLVIADVRLPDGDGLDVVRAARALPGPPPVLVATVLASRASHQSSPGRRRHRFPGEALRHRRLQPSGQRPAREG